MKRVLRAGLAVAVIGSLVPVSRAGAQGCIVPGGGPGGVRCEDQRHPRWAGEVTALGVNSALGALTAGLAQSLRGEPFWHGFARGAAGGGVTYAGKWVSGQHFTGSGLLGREIASVGASVVANASEGRGMLERVVLPVGPVRLEIDGAASTPVRARVDVPGVITTAYAAAHPRMSLDWRSSLSAGAPVFRHRGEPDWAGRHVGGVILIRHYEEGVPGAGREQMKTALLHEQIHVAQHDFGAIVWSEPAERWLLRRVLGSTAIGRHLDLGLDLPLWGALILLLPYDQRPWEWEAHFLMRP